MGCVYGHLPCHNLPLLAIYVQFPLGAEWQTAEAYNKTLSLSLSLTYIPLSTSQCVRAYKARRSSSHQCLSCSLFLALINNLTSTLFQASSQGRSIYHHPYNCSNEAARMYVLVSVFMHVKTLYTVRNLNCESHLDINLIHTYVATSNTKSFP